jgi:hypothetical protein
VRTSATDTRNSRQHPAFAAVARPYRSNGSTLCAFMHRRGSFLLLTWETALEPMTPALQKLAGFFIQKESPDPSWIRTFYHARPNFRKISWTVSALIASGSTCAPSDLWQRGQFIEMHLRVRIPEFATLPSNASTANCRKIFSQCGQTVIYGSSMRCD